MSAIGREATAWKDGRPWRQSLHFRLLGYLQGVACARRDGGQRAAAWRRWIMHRRAPSGRGWSGPRSQPCV